MSLVQIFLPCLLLSLSTGYQTFKHGFQTSKHVRACKHVKIGPGLTRDSVGSGRSLLSTIALLAFCVQLSRSTRPICRWPEARQQMAINRHKNHLDADTQKPRAGHNRDRYGPLPEPISKVDITDMPTASI